MLKKSCGWWPIWYLLFFCHGGAEGQLQWIVKEKVTDYGQNLTLFCPVKSCCSEGAGWSIGSKTLIVDVKAFSNNPNVKYHGTYNTDGFGVVIRNLSEADLNVTYRCVYDFDWSTPKYLLHGDVFKESTDVFKESTDVFKESTDVFKESTEVPDKDKENNTVVIEIVGYIFGAVAGIYIVGGIIIGIIAYCMRRKNKKEKLKGTDEEMTPFNDSDNQMDNQPGRKMKRQNSKDTCEESKSLTDSINLTENQQDTCEESKSLTDSINLTENQQGTGEERKSLTESINLTENQQDMAEAESNTVMRSDSQESLNAEMPIQNSRLGVEMEFRIALMGETGVGKSETANTICGENYFKSGISAQPITKDCKQHIVTRFDKDISIIDTPCICNEEDNTFPQLKAQDLHAILFVMKIGRVTSKNKTTIRTFLKYFGHKIQNRVIVVFTHGDTLLRHENTFSGYLKECPDDLKQFLDGCGNRTIIFNNAYKKEQSHKQVAEILFMIENMKRANDWDMFMEAEKNLQEREVVIVEKLVVKYKDKIEEYKNTIKIKVERKVMQGRLDEIEKLRKVYEELLNNIREEVRN